MPRYRLLTAAALLCWLSASAGLSDLDARRAAAAGPPHMVLFLSDDHTRNDSTLYGSTEIRTPNMQRLAAAGMTFDQAFVASPSCAPSRAALLTGLMPARNGAEANHAQPREEIKKLPAYLQELGYEVAAFGKVGHYKQTALYGFDHFAHTGYHDDVAIAEAVKWLRQRECDKPLCLIVGTNWPHVPWPEAEQYQAESVRVPEHHVDTPETREARARYCQAVAQMDKELGQVYDAAREKLGDDVFFLHTSDHGAQWPFGKWNLYDEGIQTPLIVSWPGRIQPGVRSDALVSWIDILPTLIEIAGGQPPNDLDGRSILPVFTGDTDTHRDAIFTTHSGDRDFNVFPSRSVRTTQWKYILNLHPEFDFTSHVTKSPGDTGYWPSWEKKAEADADAARTVHRYLRRDAEELYDLAADPLELTNLAAAPEHAERTAAMRQQLHDWMRQQGDTQTVFGQPQFVAAEDPAVKPNVITVFIDDMGYSDLSCFGGTDVQTENIDRLAAEGLRFTNFYVNAPICSPSRVALSTGNYPQRWRITSFLARRAANRSRDMAQWLDPAAPMLARQLQQQGYATGHFGKWHMGGQRDVGEAPLITEYGFDQSLTNFEGLGPRVLPLCDAYDGSEPRRHDLGSADLGRGPIRWEDRSRVTAAFVSDALDFIRQAHTQNQPFYINLWPDDVHSPFFPPEALRTDEDKRALYNAVLEAMDRQLGELFDYVHADPQLRDNTLIVVASDNGPEPGAGSSAPFRGTKGQLYEGGIRSPLIVWGPGLLAEGAAGTKNDTAVLSAVDLNTSLYALTRTPLPEDAQLDGEYLSRTLTGHERQGRRAPIFWRRPPDRPGPKDDVWPDLAVRDGRWKLLVQLDGSGRQLYDLQADPQESQNLAAKHPDVAERLTLAVLRWNNDVSRAAEPAKRSDPAQTNRSLPPDKFVNPIGEGADPWVLRDPNSDRYLWCQSEGNRAITIWTSPSLTSLGEKHVVWQAPDQGPYSQQVWAPELHYLDGRWHIYFAASDGDNANHLTYVLRSDGKDPLGAYQLHGPMATGEGEDGKSPNLWAIDMTVLQHAGQRYALWSGWDAPGTDQQFLYIAPMKSPTELAGPRVRLCDNDDYLWERTEERSDSRGLHEAPQVLQHGGRTFVTYSTAASWLPTYKLGLLELTGDDPLDPDAWTKYDQPVFRSTAEVFGVGHSCFVPSPDGSQWWHVYHAKRSRRAGWQRAIFVQPFHFAKDGLPQFGQPVAAGQPTDRPAGESVDRPMRPLSLSLRMPDDAQRWNYLGHHQFMQFAADGLHLGIVPASPINDYRSGEKVVLRGANWRNVTAAVTIRFADGQRDAGMLFRVSGASVGYDAQRGYFAGLVPRSGIVVVGRMDGDSWTEVARAKVAIDTAQPQRLSVTAQGDAFTISLNGQPVLETRDATYARGSIGLRVVDTHAVFTDFQATTVADPPQDAKDAPARKNITPTRLESATDSEDHRTKPNIVILLADDLGWADVGYHSRRAETPHIDALCAAGIELDRFYVAPMCSPTRAGLMTGRYPIRFGMARAVIPPYRDHGLPPEERTLPEALGKAGYAQRAVFGKWHLGHLRPQWHPLRQGFTHFRGHYNGAIDYFRLERDGQRDWHVDWHPSDQQGYSTDLIADAAADWIRQQAPQDTPYFCYVPFNAPHSPFQAKSEDLARYEHLGGDPARVADGAEGGGRLDGATVRRALMAMIWRMDQGFGRILEAIDQSGEADNTIVWFFSDNGGIGRLPNNNEPLRGNKLDVFEGGVRVPACVRWPAAWPGGRKLSQPVGYIDVMPTLLAAAGAPPEADVPPQDGRDIGLLLKEENSEWNPRDLYFYHGQSGPQDEQIAITTPQWKLVVRGPELTGAPLTKQHEVFLFRMPDDLFEQRDLAEQQPDVVQDLLGKLVAFRRLQPADGVAPYEHGRRGFTAPPKWQLSPE